MPPATGPKRPTRSRSHHTAEGDRWLEERLRCPFRLSEPIFICFFHLWFVFVSCGLSYYCCCCYYLYFFQVVVCSFFFFSRFFPYALISIFFSFVILGIHFLLFFSLSCCYLRFWERLWLYITPSKHLFPSGQYRPKLSP